MNTEQEIAAEVSQTCKANRWPKLPLPRSMALS